MSEKDFKPNPEIVYLDTSIPRFYFDDRPKSQLNREITREWWAKRSKDFYVCTSAVTLNELKSGDYANKEETLKFIDKVAFLPINDQVMEISRYYIEHFLAPKEDIEEYKGDAVHMALCAFYKVEYLLTWNQKHLANINKLRQLRIMNARLELETPAIITPEQLMLSWR